MRFVLVALAIAASSAIHVAKTAPVAQGVRLSDITWAEAETKLTASTVVVLPVAAASVEHGLHLKLGADLAIADYLARRLADATDVVIAPPLTYHRYPGLLEYPGSSSLTLDTARALTVDVVRSFARFGPRRFYALVMPPAPGTALDLAAQALSQEGILFAYTNIAARMDRVSTTVRKQAGGSHADEIETSMMLHIDPSSVDMKLAAKDYAPSRGELQLVRKPGAPGMYSPSGVWGDATLATAEKGRVVVNGLVAALLDDIDVVRRSALPLPTNTPPVTAPPTTAPTTAGRGADRVGPSGCSAGDERTIIEIGDAYTTAWMNADADALATLWTAAGDIVHPDGMTERTRQVIRQYRMLTFRRKEYAGSRFPLTLRNIRCITADIAVADGKWELRGVSDAGGKPLPTSEGLCTLVVRRVPRPVDGVSGPASSSWLIEAYRYTMNPSATPLPTWSSRPGIIR